MNFFFQGEHLIAYLKSQLENKEKELFVIIPLAIERSQVWQLPEANSTQVTITDSTNSNDIDITRQHTSSSGSSGAGGSGFSFGCNQRTSQSDAQFSRR